MWYYEQFLFGLNLFFLITAYVFTKKTPQKFKLIFITTSYAYILAALFPYLLEHMIFNHIMLAYTFAIIVGVFVLEKMVYKNEKLMAVTDTESTLEALAASLTEEENVQVELAKPDIQAEISEDISNQGLAEDSKNSNLTVESSEGEESVNQSDDVLEQIPEITEKGEEIPGKADKILEEAQRLLEEIEATEDKTNEELEQGQEMIDKLEALEDNTNATLEEAQGLLEATEDKTNEELEQDQEVLEEGKLTVDKVIETREEGYKEKVIEKDVAPEESKETVELVQNADQIDFEHLINEGFNAKSSDDYDTAIQIFEQLLSQNPPEDLAYMVRLDIEIMRKRRLSVPNIKEER